MSCLFLIGSAAKFFNHETWDMLRKIKHFWYFQTAKFKNWLNKKSFFFQRCNILSCSLLNDADLLKIYFKFAFFFKSNFKFKDPKQFFFYSKCHLEYHAQNLIWMFLNSPSKHGQVTPIIRSDHLLLGILLLAAKKQFLVKSCSNHWTLCNTQSAAQTIEYYVRYYKFHIIIDVFSMDRTQIFRWIPFSQIVDTSLDVLNIFFFGHNLLVFYNSRLLFYFVIIILL